MGTPIIGGDITGAVTDDTGDIVTGDLDDVGLFTGTGDDIFSIQIAATYGTATIDPVTGEWSYDLDDDHPAVNALDPGETLDDVFRVLMVDATQGSDTQDVTITITGVICFAAGTLIETANGPRPVETLAPETPVLTLDHGLQPVRWMGGRVFDARALEEAPWLRPIRVKAGALGPGAPKRDLLVSPQHRLLLKSTILETMFDQSEILVAAVKLVGMPGIEIATDVAEIAYHHVLFDRHEIVLADGTPAESLLCGPEAMKMLGPAAVAEIAALNPPVLVPAVHAVPARPVVDKGRRIARFLERAQRNDKALLEFDWWEVTLRAANATRAEGVA